MRLDLLTRYRPTRTADGEGGFDDVLGEGYDFYGIVSVHTADLVLIFRHGSDVQMEDVVLAADAYYKIIGRFGPQAAPMQQAFIERVTKPIVPATV